MSRIEEREGRVYAAEMLASVVYLPRCMFDERGPVETMVCNLEEAAKVHPADYAKGMMKVISEVRHAV
ncbi:hypothetical protein JQF37_01715 [Pseudomonas sp. MIL9]|jgi:hypothetical protein|uniref:hypothetical protein n=1 Tax=Pseudomonas sp. MIL9 TaxID=2807620 RepID=UPI001951C83A|nr:hypothetical protein [Pseudomonas sp. MIL9]MBM6442345.1 hypothetical protein [Pseudomonas sp. MIL9]